MAESQPSKLVMRVRFPSPALLVGACFWPTPSSHVGRRATTVQLRESPARRLEHARPLGNRLDAALPPICRSDWTRHLGAGCPRQYAPIGRLHRRLEPSRLLGSGRPPDSGYRPARVTTPRSHWCGDRPAGHSMVLLSWAPRSEASSTVYPWHSTGTSTKTWGRISRRTSRTNSRTCL
jgi:hypothetical protein